MNLPSESGLVSLFGKERYPIPQVLPITFYYFMHVPLYSKGESLGRFYLKPTFT